MELFKITCVTCNAKLSVRNREIIGQIVACPRCESMVQVEAPAAVAAVLAESVESVAEKIAAEQPAAPNDFAEAATVVEPEQMPVDDLSTQAVVLVAKYRLLTWVLASFAVGAAIGGAVLLLRGDSGEEKVVSTEVTSPSESVSVEPSAEVSEKQPLETTDTVELPLSEEPVSTVIGKPVDIAEETISETPTEEITKKIIDDEPIEEVEVETLAIAEPRATSQFDALDLDPDTLDLDTIKKSASRESIVEEAPAVAPTDPDEVLSPKDPQPVQATTLPAVRRDPEQPQVEAHPQAEKLLEQRFQALSVKAMPISDLLNLISQLGGVPISVAPQQLQMAGITSRQSVSLEAKDVSLAEALRRVLEPLHLEYTTVGSQVLVVRQDAAKVRTIEYPLEELLNSTTSLEVIVGWVEQLVVPTAQPPLDETFLLETSANAMKIRQAQQLQYQVLIFLERLRLARGIPPRSRFPVKRLAGLAASANLAERLRAPTTFMFSHYTPFSEIVRYWQQELGIPILVDWPALEKLGLWPSSRIACAVENKAWSAAFDQVLEPLGLGWRSVVGGAVEITSAEAVQTELRLELYQLEQELGDQTERVLSKLRSVAKKGIAEEKPAAIAYDPTGKVLIVLQPAATQRLIYQWLVDEKLSASD